MEYPCVSKSPDIPEMEFVKIKQEPKYEEVNIATGSSGDIKEELDRRRRIKQENYPIADQDISENSGPNFEISFIKDSIDEHYLDCSDNSSYMTNNEDTAETDVTEIDGKRNRIKSSSIGTECSGRYKTMRRRLKHKCKICSKAFINLKSHMSIHSGIKEHKCFICSKEFGRPGHLKIHMVTHTGIKEYKCLICSKEFGQSSHLKTHNMVTHSTIKEYKCHICEKAFGLSSYLRSHMTTHAVTDSCAVGKAELDSKIKEGETDSNADQDISEPIFEVYIIKDEVTMDDHDLDLSENSSHMNHNNVSSELDLSGNDIKRPRNTSAFVQLEYLKQINSKRHKCAICGKEFSQSGNLKYHMIKHTGIKAHKCEICHKHFGLSGHLKTHMLIHTGIKEYKCTLCDKKFSQAGNLKSHMVTHTGVKEQKCDICGKQFGLSGHLKSHMVTHTGIKKYKCAICSKEFGLSGHLKNHMVIHTDIKLYKCDICNKEFSRSTYLKTHKRKHTSKDTIQ